VVEGLERRTFVDVGEVGAEAVDGFEYCGPAYETHKVSKSHSILQHPTPYPMLS